jgi:hypothetical protein
VGAQPRVSSGAWGRTLEGCYNDQRCGQRRGELKKLATKQKYLGDGNGKKREGSRSCDDGSFDFVLFGGGYTARGHPSIKRLSIEQCPGNRVTTGTREGVLNSNWSRVTLAALAVATSSDGRCS